jgi:hypothetical protein
LLPPEHASRLLDDVLYERVLACVDLETLFLLETELWLALAECEIAEDEAAKELAKALIDRALGRLPDEPRRYRLVRPFGEGCPDCEAELREATRSTQSRKPG